MKNRSFAWMMVILLSGLMLTMINQSIINIIIPQIMLQFQVPASTAQWLSTGFMLVMGILVPISAYLIQKYTYRNLFLTAIFIFALGSLFCAVASSFAFMMAGRILQAGGAGILMPLGMNVFLAVYPPEKRGAAMGWLGMGMFLAPAIGPTIGGYVVEYYNWHVLFWGMTVLSVCIGILSFFKFNYQNERNKVRLDMIGVVASSIGFGGLLYSFSEVGTRGWRDAYVAVTLIVAALVLVFFVFYELRKENPLLELRIFKDLNFTFTMLVNIVLTMALFGGILLLPLYLQNVRGFSPLESGFLLMPGTLLMGIIGIFAGKFYDRYGIKALAITGIGIITAATFMLSRLTLESSYGEIMMVYTVRCIGMAFVGMPIVSAGLIKIPLELIPHATALQNTFKQVAGSMGTAILVVVMTSQTQTAIQPEQAGDLLSLQMAAVRGFDDAFLLAAGFGMVALILTFFFKKKTPTVKKLPEQNKKGFRGFP